MRWRLPCDHSVPEMMPEPPPNLASPVPRLPERGLCAHRGVMEVLPENSLASLQEAVRLGAQMIEFDLRESGDGEILVFHDKTLERMTDGAGLVMDFTVAGLKQFRLRCPRTGALTGERIPTLSEALGVLPRNIWLNLHLKARPVRVSFWSRLLGSFRHRETPPAFPARVTRLLTAENRLHQAVLACLPAQAAVARTENPAVQICSLERRHDAQAAVRAAIADGARFIQMSDKRPPTPELMRELKQNGLRVTYGFADSPESVRQLFERGVDFPLVNNLHELMPHAAQMGLEPVTHEP